MLSSIRDPHTPAAAERRGAGRYARFCAARGDSSPELPRAEAEETPGVSSASATGHTPHNRAPFAPPRAAQHDSRRKKYLKDPNNTPM